MIRSQKTLKFFTNVLMTKKEKDQKVIRLVA